MELLLPALVYVAALATAAFINKREFARCPEKGERYRALPLGYKLACWFVVIPLIAAAVLHGAFFLLAILSFALLEGACIRWYRKKGLL
jgi:hypothetical protein